MSCRWPLAPDGRFSFLPLRVKEMDVPCHVIRVYNLPSEEMGKITDEQHLNIVMEFLLLGRLYPSPFADDRTSERFYEYKNAYGVW
ncbi:hypothetical protein AVEN_140662-1 [Araneus ventricosus]|uniref:Uncharacterized protein n=1 Tax=Araneus ventricosus TaxID=182803 RepID=A0A4Y2C539_ARAVE|nr:hypothetical protein AVEN_140662-1 [Araneus ventricosus]